MAKPAYVIQNALPLSPQRVGMVKKMYHTQEKRASKLTAPIICSRRDAWLGEGYYFWWYPIDAILWGENSKKATGYYEVYSAEILLDNVLNTSFNIEHYEAWNEIIASIARDIATKTGHTATVQQVNDYVRKRAGWQTVAGVEGILMDDTTGDARRLLVAGLPHRRRIQLVAYNTNIISNFTFYKGGKCR